MNKDYREQTVEEYIQDECSLGFLSELTAGSTYWTGCDKFVNENLKKKLNELSPKQRQWLIRIKEGIIDEALK